MNQAVLAAKTETVKTITEKAKESQTIIVCEYRGLTVAQIQEVRRALHKENAEMNVYKNSLVERAVDELGYNEMNDILKGPNAIVFSKDVIGGAKVIAKYAKRHKTSRQRRSYFHVLIVLTSTYPLLRLRCQGSSGQIMPI